MCLIHHQAHEELWLHIRALLTSALDGGDWLLQLLGEQEVLFPFQAVLLDNEGRTSVTL